LIGSQNSPERSKINPLSDTRLRQADMVVTRETFDRHLRKLIDDVLVLGSMVEQAVLKSVDALRRRDAIAAEEIIRFDQKINEKRYGIEAETLTLIATQQPMARDLRLLAAVFEISTELERMGDYAKGISRINLMMGDEMVTSIGADLQRMAECGLDMLHRALSAFVARDAETAREIPRDDDEVDALYNHIYRELMQEMIQDPSRIDRVNYLAWAAHNLERMADRVTNICERIVFVITGEMKELDVTDDEMGDRPS
jgi:phosphate transport system protein